jgi:aryl-alcohol dehydrogenase-like predicted oxidoreductase
VEDWERAMRSALDLGINFIDTADAYGDGDAESALGDLMAREGWRDKVVIATKFLWNFEQAERVADSSYEYILRECEASLKRLKTDCIDLYQIHAWDPLTRPEEVATAINRLKKEGKIRWFGVSNLNVDQIRMYSQYVDVECLQPMYNMVRRECEASLFPLCLEKRIGVITWSPLYSGLLTGKYRRDQKFDDFRADEPLFQTKALGHILDGLDALKPIAEANDLTIPQLAIRWVLTHPAVTSAIVGAKKPEHIETIVKAADDELPRRDWYRVANIMAEAKSKAEKA